MDRITLLILFLVVVDCSLFIMQLTLLPFKAKTLGLDAVQIGYIATIFALVQLVGNPIFGRICDLVSIRTTFLINFASWTVLMALTGLAESFRGLLLSRLPLMFCLGMQAAQSAIPKFTSGEDRDTAMAHIGTALGLGVIIGPFTGGLLSSYLGNNMAFLCAFSVSLGMVGLVYIALPIDLGSQGVHSHLSERKDAVAHSPDGSGFMQTYLTILKKNQVAALMVIKALAIAPFFVNDSILSLYLVQVLDLSPAQHGSMGVYMGVLQTLSVVVIVPRVRNRLSPRTIFQLAGSLIMYASIGLCFFRTFHHLFLINPGFAVSSAMVNAVADSSLCQAVSEKESGACFGASNAIISFVGVVAPVLSGYMSEILGFNFLIYFGLFIAASLYTVSWKIQDSGAEVSNIKKAD